MNQLKRLQPRDAKPPHEPRQLSRERQPIRRSRMRALVQPDIEPLEGIARDPVRVRRRVGGGEKVPVDQERLQGWVLSEEVDGPWRSGCARGCRAARGFVVETDDEVATRNKSVCGTEGGEEGVPDRVVCACVGGPRRFRGG